LPGESQPEASLLDRLKTTFDVVRIDDVAGLGELVADDSSALLVCSPRLLEDLRAAMPTEPAVNVLQHIGEGVGMVDADGTVTWANAQLQGYDDQTRQQARPSACSTKPRSWTFQSASARKASLRSAATIIISSWLSRPHPPRPTTTAG
jgi:hypothetical protein